MNRKVGIIGGVVGLVLAAVLIGWLYFQLNPAAWDSFLEEMGGAGTSAPRPAAQTARKPERRSGELAASGAIEATEVTVSSSHGGRIIQLAAEEGQDVATGDLLLQLDARTLEARQAEALAGVARAKAALSLAQAQLDKALAGATDHELAAADAAVLSAEGALAAAEAVRLQAQAGADSARTLSQADSAVIVAAANLAQAQGAQAAAEAELAAAQAQLARLLAGPRPEEVAVYQAQVDQAHAQYLIYENLYQDNFISKGIGGSLEEQARFQRDSAKAAWDAAQAQLDLVEAGATAEEIAAARAAVRAAQAQVDMAAAGVTAAHAQVGQSGAAPATRADSVIAAEAQTAAAEAQVTVAQGGLALAEAERDHLAAGATEQDLTMLRAQVQDAEALVASARAGLMALEVELADAQVTAPSGGVVVACLVHQGELAAPGAPLLVLADLDAVTLTVYVPEAELGRVSLGQEVSVRVDAYEDVFEGQVSHIASEAEFTPSNVQTQEERVHMVFAVKVRLANADHYLKPGMPADAVFH